MARPVIRCVRKASRLSGLAGLAEWPDQKNDADYGDHRPAQHLSISFYRSKREVLQRGARHDAERNVRSDRAQPKAESHYRKQTHAKSRSRKERRNALQHRRGPEDEEQRDAPARAISRRGGVFGPTAGAHLA